MIHFTSGHFPHFTSFHLYSLHFAFHRFRLRPGYRWDAIDRGSGFERKVLLRMSERGGAKEDEYRWSVSDL